MGRVSGRQDIGDYLPKLGAVVRELRSAEGLSQEALADAAGIDRSHMGKIERGERNVTFLNLLKIADALSVKPSELFLRAGM